MTLKQKTYQLAIVTDINQLPEGCVSISELDATTPEKNALRMAMRDGRVQGYKVAKTMADLNTGAIWGVAEHVQAYLEYYRKPPEMKKSPNVPEPAPQPEKVCGPSEDTILLREIASRLETIVKKLEQLAL